MKNWYILILLALGFSGKKKPKQLVDKTPEPPSSPVLELPTLSQMPTIGSPQLTVSVADLQLSPQLRPSTTAPANQKPLLHGKVELEDIWKAASVPAAFILRKMRDNKLDPKKINEEMQRTAGATLSPQSIRKMAKALSELAGIQTEPLRTVHGFGSTAPALFGQELNAFSLPWDGWYCNKPWLPNHAPLYPYRAPTAYDFTGNGLNNHAFPEMSVSAIEQKLVGIEHLVPRLLWQCAVAKVVHAQCKAKILSDQGVFAGGIFDKMLKDGLELAKKEGQGWIEEQIGTKKKGQQSSGGSLEDIVAQLVKDILDWVLNFFAKEFQEHNDAVKLQTSVVGAANNVWPFKGGVVAEINPEYLIRIGDKKDGGSWLSYHRELQEFGQAATHDTFGSIINVKEYEGVYSGALTAVFGGLFDEGKLFLNFDDEHNWCGLDNIREGKRARDAFRDSIGRWQDYRPKPSRYGTTPYDGKPIRTVWRQ